MEDQSTVDNIDLMHSSTCVLDANNLHQDLKYSWYNLVRMKEYADRETRGVVMRIALSQLPKSQMDPFDLLDLRAAMKARVRGRNTDPRAAVPNNKWRQHRLCP